MADNKKETTEKIEETDASEQPLVSHLIELRDRIIRSLIVLVVVFVVLFPFANDIFDFVAAPLINALPEGAETIITGVADGFFVPMKLTIFVAFAITMPYILHQAWAFIAPGLYKNEIRVASPILISSIVLFYLGILFAYFVVLGFTFAFFAYAGPEVSSYKPDIANVVGFLLKVFFAFGLCFEIPVAVVLLVLIGVLNPYSLTDKRPYVIVGCFTVAMFLTPTDPFSLFLLAIPMCLLFELGIIAGKIVYRRREEEEKAKEESASDADE
jgi:sec-independent protein translocase protein TatC